MANEITRINYQLRLIGVQLDSLRTNVTRLTEEVRGLQAQKLYAGKLPEPPTAEAVRKELSEGLP